MTIKKVALYEPVPWPKIPTDPIGYVHLSDATYYKLGMLDYYTTIRIEWWPDLSTVSALDPQPTLASVLRVTCELIHVVQYGQRRWMLVVPNKEHVALIREQEHKAGKWRA